ncbi:protein of unknown function [Streptomyces sp. KY75]|nr:protein of unknown function [Streptomyces sp. KY75]
MLRRAARTPRRKVKRRETPQLHGTVASLKASHCPAVCMALR